MARKKIIRTRTASIRTDASPRHLWLASLGVAVIAGREGKAAVSGAAQRIALVRKQAIAAVGQAQSNVRSTVSDLRSQIEAGAGELVSKLESTAQPLIAKFKPAKAKRAVRRGRPVGSKNVRRAVKQTKVKKAVRGSRKA